MSTPRHSLLLALALAAALAVWVPDAWAAPAPAGIQAGHPTKSASSEAPRRKSSAPCNVEDPVIGGIESAIANGICGAAEEAAGAVGGLAGEAAGAVGSGILDAVATWMIGAASQVTSFVAQETQRSTTPQLQSAWFGAQTPRAAAGVSCGARSWGTPCPWARCPGVLGGAAG